MNDEWITTLGAALSILVILALVVGIGLLVIG